MLKSDTLHQELIKAHEKQDGPSLAALYQLAGEKFEAKGDIDSASFYYTNAYIFALEYALPSADIIHNRLVKYDREI